MQTKTSSEHLLISALGKYASCRNLSAQGKFVSYGCIKPFCIKFLRDDHFVLHWAEERREANSVPSAEPSDMPFSVLIDEGGLKYRYAITDEYQPVSTLGKPLKNISFLELVGNTMFDLLQGRKAISWFDDTAEYAKPYSIDLWEHSFSARYADLPLQADSMQMFLEFNKDDFALIRIREIGHFSEEMRVAANAGALRMGFEGRPLDELKEYYSEECAYFSAVQFA